MTDEPDAFDDEVGRIASLGEPVRRALYRFVAGQAEPVTREQAADAVGIARHAAKFHLDRLETEGLLEVDYRRPPGRGGPGAGRPAKVYRRSAREFSVSLPDRRYELLGGVMAAAIGSAVEGGAEVGSAVRKAAGAAGQAAGRQASVGGRRSGRGQLEAVGHVLADCGYEPRLVEERIELANCPFHQLAQDHTDLVCGINLAFVEGVVEELGSPPRVSAELDPCPGRCCVTVGRA